MRNPCWLLFDLHQPIVQKTGGEASKEPCKRLVKKMAKENIIFRGIKNLILYEMGKMVERVEDVQQSQSKGHRGVPGMGR